MYGFGADTTATPLEREEISQPANDIYPGYTKITRGYYT